MDDMEGKIVLDRKSFEALAVDSRVRILKSLKEKRKTLSEISKEQGMSLSGVKEHLEPYPAGSRPYFSVEYRGRDLLLDSPLGLDFRDAPPLARGRVAVYGFDTAFSVLQKVERGPLYRIERLKAGITTGLSGGTRLLNRLRSQA